ncbi:hypothetical protein L207DRAFT_586273 [Hyaloscypha variabilis F]|uniref:Uncharacterized protein n=1 Tax=Hyaloscypha variabilis (strain UAMH 11265 / GT02V1 / F) TaxID=1149755 RepID=A0A2J6RDI1_HYAVF|nr:hypothetical protein L207DRAFT_586273 [Hyaloscypha variabilis F]
MALLYPPSKRPKTELAEKYGHPLGPEHGIIHGLVPLKSGLTPLLPGPFISSVDNDLKNLMYRYQQRRFRGWDARELLIMKAFAAFLNDPVPTISDTYHIHPFYVKTRWASGPGLLTHIARYPLANGRPGYWEASNDAVWATLQPALRLATLFLTSSYGWTWWDAFYAGTWTEIAQEEKRGLGGDQFDDLILARFRARSGVDIEAAKARKQQQMTDAANMITLAFRSGRNSIYGGLPDTTQTGFMHGTTVLRTTDHAEIFIAFELLEPLMSMNLTPAERGVETLRIATVILHETAHALSWLYYKPIATEEPYYEDERISEMHVLLSLEKPSLLTAISGYSYENALFGGCFTGLQDSSRDLGDHSHAAGAYSDDFNTLHFHQHIAERPTLSPVPESFFTTVTSVVPAPYYCSMQQKDFWDVHVKKYGSRSTHVKQWAVVQKHTVYENAPGNPILRNFQDYPYNPFVYDVDINPTLPEEEKTDIKLENRRRQVAREILAATRDYQRQSFYIRELQEKVLLAKDNPLPKVPPEIPSLPECPRFDEIRLYLFARLQELAIDTMNGPIPEHVLLKYILTRRELVINGDEWRAFLYICNDRKFLFRLEPHSIADGVVTKVNGFWPDEQQTGLGYGRPPPAWGKPNDYILQAFRHYVDLLANNPTGVYDQGHRDYDAEDLRRKINQSYNRDIVADPVNFLNNPDGAVIQEIGQFLFEACVHHCALQGVCVTWGPQGIVRRIYPAVMQGGGQGNDGEQGNDGGQYYDDEDDDLSPRRPRRRRRRRNEDYVDRCNLM